MTVHGRIACHYWIIFYLCRNSVNPEDAGQYPQAFQFYEGLLQALRDVSNPIFTLQLSLLNNVCLPLYIMGH